jgi:hypothetical protein
VVAGNHWEMALLCDLQLQSLGNRIGKPFLTTTQWRTPVSHWEMALLCDLQLHQHHDLLSEANEVSEANHRWEIAL